MSRVQEWFWKLFKWFFFKIDAEMAHVFILKCVRLGIRLGNRPLSLISSSTDSSRPQKEAQNESQEKFEQVGSTTIRVFDKEFYSRVGLAAGFDKNCEILEGLPALGFGFAEIGTVTPRSQEGHPKPRLFRDIQNEAIFNKMGFNNLGARIVSERLSCIKKKLPSNFRVGVNLGKNKDTKQEEAHRDYVQVAAAFEELADYLVMNVSSPNTPGLRDLQNIEFLKILVQEVVGSCARWKRRVPILLKLAPEVVGNDLIELIQAIEPLGIDGWVLANTWGGSLQTKGRVLQGGWSGKPLTDASRESLIQARRVTKKPIISVGGILSSDEAVARIKGGADLIQIYTGWIYRGPSFPQELGQKIDALNKKA
jgi:dihydroorotate dehydrogenase